MLRNRIPRIRTSVAPTNIVSRVDDDRRAQPPDPMLNETEHILEDYISLLSKNASLIANQ